MAKKKSKISKTELKLKGKIKYQKTKLREVKKELENIKSLDKRKKIEVKEDFSNLKKGKAYKYKSVNNAIINEGVKINSEIYKLELKLKEKFFFKPSKYKDNISKDGEYRHVVGKAWDNSEINNAVFKNPEISHINGLKISKDLDKINDLLNSLKMKMGSKDNLILIYDGNMKARLSLIDDDDLEDSESEF